MTSKTDQEQRGTGLLAAKYCTVLVGATRQRAKLWPSQEGVRKGIWGGQAQREKAREDKDTGFPEARLPRSPGAGGAWGLWAHVGEVGRHF